MMPHVQPTLDGLLREIMRDVVREEIRAVLSTTEAAPVRNASDSYLSVTKAAQVADVARGTIRAWIRNGRITAKRAGRVWRISRAELERFLSGAPDEVQQAATRKRAEDIHGRARKPLRVVSA